MRGRSHIGSSYKDSFWKWREDMYSVVEHIDEKMLYEVGTIVAICFF